MVCSVCGVRLGGGGTMRTDYLHPNGIVAACVNGDWRPITEQQLADELAALRKVVKAAATERPKPDGHATTAEREWDHDNGGPVVKVYPGDDE